MSSLTIRSASRLSVLMAGFLSGGAIMCTSYLLERSLEIALPVVLDSMTTLEPSGTFSMNSATPRVVVLKTNVFDGVDDVSTSSPKTQVVQLFLCASIPTLVISYCISYFVWLPWRHGSKVDHPPVRAQGTSGLVAPMRQSC